ncbi:ACT domain-containing protein [Enterococcus sp. AZ103]|uniref:ACT domain-containing protein n=1 Tax=Enterococcus sp. AZ103 TaxID=2774628 RepID=UPI003F20A947
MKINKINVPLSVIQVAAITDIDLSVSPLFIGKTEDELSVVLPTQNVPSMTLSREDDWKGFKIEGVLDFSLVGILSKISSLLADANISIFAISTYNTDYILVKATHFDKSIEILENTGYKIV